MSSPEASSERAPGAGPSGLASAVEALAAAWPPLAYALRLPI
jgi:hypothetical protein